jgi:hypothetical protein
MINKEKGTDSKLLLAAAVGGAAGFMLGAYIWSKKDGENPVAGILKPIATAIEQLEEINTGDANSLIEKLKVLLLNLSEKYGKTEE